MAFAESYRRQVRLLLQALPYVAEEKDFALKGGTAINLFVRNMPRLSVDTDLTYLPVQPRAESLDAIDAALGRIAERARKGIPGARVHETRFEGRVAKLVLAADGAQIKIEVTPVLRGCVYEPEVREVSKAVEAEFGFAETQVVSFADLYAGKIVAALDRQHPRDLFDIRDLLANEGIDDALRRAFIVYMLSHDRPMFEVLDSAQKDIRAEFERGFEGMTDKPVELKDLLDARAALVKAIVTDMPVEHRKFLVSFEKGEPDWKLLGLDGVDKLPAVLWRQQNLDKIPAAKRAELVKQLERVLGM
jgi:predicted nucleotidyltransferase component of viral defense system